MGGAALGHDVEEKLAKSHYRITVRRDSGGTLIVEDPREVELRVGDGVRADKDRVHRLWL